MPDPAASHEDVAPEVLAEEPEPADPATAADSSGPGLGRKVLAVTAEVLPKMMASGLHLGLTRTAMGEVTAGLAEGGTVKMLGGAVATALVSGVVHFAAEMVVKPVVTNAIGTLIKPRKPGDVFPYDAPTPGSETAAEKRARMTAQQALGKVGSASGDAIGLAGFGTAQGTRTALGKVGHNANMVASGVGGGLMQVGHSVTNLLTSVDGEATHEIVVSQDPLAQRLLAGLAEVMPKNVPDGAGGQRKESRVEMGARIVHNIVVGRALPMLQGGFAQAAVNAAIKKAGIGQNFGTGMSASVALLALGVFPGLATLPGRLGKTGGLFDGVKSALTVPPQQLAALVSKDHSVVRGALRAVDITHGAVKSALVLPAHAAADTVSAGVRVAVGVAYAVRGAMRSGAEDEPDREMA